MASSAVVINNLSKKFANPGGVGEFTVIDSISLDIQRGTFASIVGPSGCGKSTLLNIIAGIESYNDGEVTIHSTAGTTNSTHPRIGYVFQQVGLLPQNANNPCR